MSLGVQEEHHLRAAKELRHHTVERLWKITEELNILYKDNWTALANREIVKFQKELLAAELLQLKDNRVDHGEDDHGERKRVVVEDGGGGGGDVKRKYYSIHEESPKPWSFSDSFLYSLSLITTVGKYRKEQLDRPLAMFLHCLQASCTKKKFLCNN